MCQLGCARWNGAPTGQTKAKSGNIPPNGDSDQTMEEDINIICPSWLLLLSFPLFCSTVLLHTAIPPHPKDISVSVFSHHITPWELPSTACSTTTAIRTPSLALPPLNIPLPTAPAVPSAPVQIQMKTGQKYQTWQSDGEFKIGLHNGITVRLHQTVVTFEFWDSLNNHLTGKKIKRRLEDLERRAGSSSASPEQSHAELVTTVQPRRKNEDGVKRQKSMCERSKPNQKASPERPTPSYSSAKDERSGIFNRPYSREMSGSPSPSLNYSYPLPEPVIHTPYPQHAPFHTLPAPFPDFPGQPLYLPPLPVTLPSMLSYELGSAKSECLFDEDDMLNQYNMNFTPLSSMDIPTTQSYQDSNVHVNHPEYRFHFQ